MSKRKKALAFATIFVIFTFSIGVIIGQFIKITELEQELRDTQEQLLISNDQLKMIEMRNEAIKYIEENNK